MANIMRAKKLIICANNLISTSPFLWPGNNFCGRRTLASVFLRFYSDHRQEVCNGANIYKEGQDPFLKPDSDYPEWLWKLDTEKINLEDLSMDDKRYWRKLRKAKIKQHNALRKQGKLI